MSLKPILFHDIDGVLFGTYAGAFQLRPGVNSWLRWVHENYELVWLTTWRPETIRQLLDSIYMTPTTKQPFRCADWYQYLDKESWLVSAASKLHGREWWWIDDLKPRMDILSPAGIGAEHCIRVNPVGEDALLSLRERLEAVLSLDALNPKKCEKICQPRR